MRKRQAIFKVSHGLTLFGKVLQEAFVKQPAQLPVQVKHCWHRWLPDLGLGDTPTKAPPRKWMNLTLIAQAEHILYSAFVGSSVRVGLDDVSAPSFCALVALAAQPKNNAPIYDHIWYRPAAPPPRHGHGPIPGVGVGGSLPFCAVGMGGSLVCMYVCLYVCM